MQVYVSDEVGVFPPDPVVTSTWADDQTWKIVTFDAVTGASLRLVALSPANGKDPWASGAELEILGSSNVGPVPDSPTPPPEDPDPPTTPPEDPDPALDSSGWIINANSEESRREDGSVSNLLDGDEGTIWHTQWSSGPSDGVPDYPHSVTIDFAGELNAVTGLRYLPRQDEHDNGNIGTFEVRHRVDRGGRGAPNQGSAPRVFSVLRVASMIFHDEAYSILCIFLIHWCTACAARRCMCLMRPGCFLLIQL